MNVGQASDSLRAASGSQYTKSPVSTGPSIRKPASLLYYGPDADRGRHPIADPLQEVLPDPNRAFLTVIPIRPNRHQRIRDVPDECRSRSRMNSSQMHRERIGQPLPLRSQTRIAQRIRNWYCERQHHYGLVGEAEPVEGFAGSGAAFQRSTDQVGA
jgi:hypothetical protein